MREFTLTSGAAFVWPMTRLLARKEGEGETRASEECEESAIRDLTFLEHAGHRSAFCLFSKYGLIGRHAPARYRAH